MPRADVVYVTITHSLVGFMRDGLLILGAQLFRVPVVVHHHGGAFHEFYERAPRWIRPLVRLSLARTQFIIALGESLRHEFSMVSGAEQRVRVVPNTCTASPCGPRNAPSTELRVLYLSNLMVEKGYLDVLEAASLIRDRLPGWNVEFHFAGEFRLGGEEFKTTAEMEHDFHMRQAKLDRTARVIFHGIVQGDEKAALLRSAHVFVLPTYYRDEGQPISIIEALTSALPVIATAHRGIPELLPREMDVLAVPPRDGAAIADRIRLIAMSPRLYERLSFAAAARARDFSLETHVDALDRLLSEAAALRRDGVNAP